MKALSIMRVFLVHCVVYYGYELGKIHSYIFPFYVNIIFFVSGYLLFRKQLGGSAIDETVKEYPVHSGRTMFWNIIYRIFFPTVLFSTLEFLPKKIIRGETLVMTEFLWETIGGRTYWFTCALLCAELIILLFLFTRCRNIWMYWLVSMVLMGMGAYMIDNGLTIFGLTYNPWALDHGLCAVSFLVSGGLFWKYESLLQRIMSKSVVVLMVLAYLVVFTFFDTEIMGMMEFSYLSWYPIGCMAALLLIGVCRYLPSIPFITFIGQYSIGFYFMSGAMPTVMSILFLRFTSVPVWYGLVAVWLFSMIVAYFMTYILNRYFPWMFDFRLLWKQNPKTSVTLS